MIQNLSEISVDQLLGKVQDMFHQGYRFVTSTSVDIGEEGVDITYHFDKNYEMVNYRIKVPKGAQIPSISGIYFSAAIVENEIKELFGVDFLGMVVDYGGHMLLTDDAPENPMLRQQIIIEKREGK